MADTEIAPFLNKLGYMLLAEVDSLQEVKHQLWSLRCMLTRLMPFVMEVERKQTKSKDLMEEDMEKAMEIITVIHEADDAIDLYLDIIKRKYLGTDEGCEVKSHIEGMRERLKELHEWFLEYTDQSCSTCATISSSSKRPPPTEEDDDYVVVGEEDEVKRMIDLLEDEDARLVVIPVVGPRGMGKTTFARNVYNHPTIVEHFPYRSWICVPSHYKLEELLQQIVEQIKSNITTVPASPPATVTDNINEMTSLNDLAIQIYKLLKSPTRYLLVFDDVCKTQLWADINIVFADNKRGSRIIVTTRHDEVALHAARRSCRPPFYLRRLSKEQSKELFSKRVGNLIDNSHSRQPDDELNHHHHHPFMHWQKWVDASGGLPLTIVSLAVEYQGLLLSMKHKNNNDDDDDHSRDDEVVFPLGIWKLIYSDLPHHLKVCLDYLYVLKGGYSVHDFKGLIVAEGLVKPPSQSVIQDRRDTSAAVELEDIAEGYVNELIHRNLIVVQSRKFDGGIK